MILDAGCLGLVHAHSRELVTGAVDHALHETLPCMKSACTGGLHLPSRWASTSCNHTYVAVVQRACWFATGYAPCVRGWHPVGKTDRTRFEPVETLREMDGMRHTACVIEVGALRRAGAVQAGESDREHAGPGSGLHV